MLAASLGALCSISSLTSSRDISSYRLPLQGELGALFLCRIDGEGSARWELGSSTDATLDWRGCLASSVNIVTCKSREPGAL